jgi:hypothetical protein
LGKRGKDEALFAIPKKSKRAPFIAGTLEHWNIAIFHIKTTWNIARPFWNIGTLQQLIK